MPTTPSLSITARIYGGFGLLVAIIGTTVGFAVLKLDIVDDQISQVVSLIANIASQTNPRALNATVEANRMGIAVVASEVKRLPSQTTRATEEIGVQVSGIQTATREAVDAIKSISTGINQVSAIAASIAAVVEEQGAATAEIARNVQQTASAAQDVTSNIGSVGHASTQTGEAAALVLVGGTLSQQAEQLSREVAGFIAHVRAA